MIKYLQLKKQSKYKINDICNKFNLESNSTLLSIYAFALAGFSKFIFTTAGQWPPQRGYFARITWLTIEFNDWESMIRSKRTLCHAILVWNHTCDFKSNECAITTLFHPCWNQIITNYQETTFYTQINFLFKPSIQSAEPEKLRKKIVSFHNYDFRPKLHDMMFNYHFIISILKLAFSSL